MVDNMGTDPALEQAREQQQSFSLYGSMQGKFCVITGGTKGLGAATAKLLSRLGALVLVTGRDENRGRKLQEEFKGITYRRVDHEDRADVLNFVEWLEAKYERIDVLIINAARNSRYDVTTLEIEEWDRMTCLLLTSPFLLSKWAARKMISTRSKGKIITVAAIQAYSPLESSFAYATLKGGLISMTRSLAVDLGKYGIQSFAVVPGPFYVAERPMPPGLDARAASLLGRMGRPDEMARLLVFLASDNNSFMTGNTIVVDGGRLISRKSDPEEIKRETV